MKKIIGIALLVLLSMLTSCSLGDNRSAVSDTIGSYDKDAEEYSIIFKDVDDKVIDFQVLKYNYKIQIPKTPEKSSPRYEYTFMGWDYNSDDEIDTIPEYATFSFVAKALYSLEYKKYEVNFELDCDAYEGDITQQVNFGSAAIAPSNIQKYGYTFTGWDSSFDYITGEKTIHANWKLNEYKISFEVNKDLYLIERDENYHLISNRTYFHRLPIPKYVKNDLHFEGWEYNGKKITNYAGDLYEPLVLESDILLKPIFRAYTIDEVYTMGYLITNKVTNEEEINAVADVISTYSISTPFFHGNKIYCKDGDTIYQLKEIEYIYIDIYKDHLYAVSAMPNEGMFISKEVLFYDTTAAKDKILAQMDLMDDVYYDTVFTLPYDYISVEAIGNKNERLSSLMDLSTESYKEKYYSSIEVSTHLKISSLDSFLISNSQLDTGCKLLNSQGSIDTLNSTDLYGYRIGMRKTIGLQGTFDTAVID